MAKPEKGSLQKAWHVAKKSKWTLAAGAGWMIGIPIVPGLIETMLIGVGAVKDMHNHAKSKEETPKQNKILGKDWK